MSVDCIITTAGLFSPSRIEGQLIYSLYSYSFVIIRRPHCPEIENHPTKETSFFLSRTVRSISAFMSANLSNSWKKCMNMYTYSVYVNIMLIYYIIL